MTRRLRPKSTTSSSTKHFLVSKQCVQVVICTHFLWDFVLESNDVRNMAAVSDSEEPAELGLLILLEFRMKIAVNTPEPEGAQKNPHGSSCKHLSHRMVTQVNARVHDQWSKCPRQRNGDILHVVCWEREIKSTKTRQINGEEWHELRMAWGPSIGLACFQCSTRDWSWLPHYVLNDLQTMEPRLLQQS